MGHTIYTTDAMVLKSVPTGESDTTLWLLSDALGLITARAQGMRKYTSKMRGYLQLFAPVRVSLVRGKHIWRITGAEHTQQFIAPLHGDALSACARIMAFVMRMIVVNAESASYDFSAVYVAVLNARKRLAIQHSIAETIELETYGYILVHLGYLHKDFLEHISLHTISSYALKEHINKAIQASHL